MASPILKATAACLDGDGSAGISRLKPDSVLARIAGLPEATLSDDELVVLDLNHAKYYGMSGPGSRIWAMLETETTLHELCARLANEFDVSKDACLKETREFVGELLRENLVRIVPQR